MSIPRHIGFIMDGNGRWATRKHLPRSAGHRRGVSALKIVVNACIEEGINVISLFAFSSENWKRPKNEISSLFNMLREFLDKNLDKEFVKPIRVIVMGDISKLPDDLQEGIKNAVIRSQNTVGIIINIGINYGSRSEIVEAYNKMFEAGVTHATEELISSYLYTDGLPNPDIIVRTGGEMRLSNFMLYQSAYSELIFVETLWPDMGSGDVSSIIEEYSRRDRKYGGVGDNKDAE